jgi:hypothetical protein
MTPSGHAIAPPQRNQTGSMVLTDIPSWENDCWYLQQLRMMVLQTPTIAGWDMKSQNGLPKMRHHQSIFKMRIAFLRVDEVVSSYSSPVHHNM